MPAFYLSCLLAFTGGHLVNYSVILYLQEKVGSDLLSGIGFGLSFGTSIVFGWFAGVLCDRISPTRVIHAAQVLFLFCLAGLWWTDVGASAETRVAWTLFSAFLGGLAWSFVGPARLASLGQIAPPEQTQLAREASINGRQFLIAHKRNHGFVKFDVAQVVLRMVLLDNRLLHAVNQALQGLELFCTGLSSQGGADMGFHHGAHIKNFQGLVERHLADKNATVFLQLHQARLLQHPKGFTHRSPRYPQPFSQSHLGQLVPWGQFAAVDESFNGLLHCPRQGAFLQHVNRRVGVGKWVCQVLKHG